MSGEHNETPPTYSQPRGELYRVCMAEQEATSQTCISSVGVGVCVSERESEREKGLLIYTFHD